MKNLIYLSLAILTVIGFSGCKKDKKTPTAVVETYVDNLKDRNYDVLVEMMYCEDPFIYDELQREPERYSDMLKTNVEQHTAKKGGIKKTQVVSEKVSPDGKQAEVVVRKEYNEGIAEDITYNLLNVNDDWKVKMSPHKEVWKTKMADGTHVSFKLKDFEHKEVVKEHIGDERDFVKDIHTDNKHVVKVKEDGDKDVIKVKEKKNETVIKEKHDGHKEVRREKHEVKE